MCNILMNAALFLLILHYTLASCPFAENGGEPGKQEDTVEKSSPEDQKRDTSMQLDDPDLPPALKLPESQRIQASEVHKSLFRPENNIRPLPKVLKSILLPSPPQPPVATLQPPAPRPVEILCHLDRIYVRVVKCLFTDPDAWKYLKVGTCVVNEAKDGHYYFLYPLDSCNVKRQEDGNRVTYSNTLYYEPVSTELVVRELPFSVSLECHYHKNFRSYQVGFRPVMEGETITWDLPSSGVSLQPVNELWMPFTSWHRYTIGQPIYFVAKAPRRQEGKRVYLNNCYITSSPSPTSTPKYTILDNYGCMVDSKKSEQTKFYASDDTATVRFSLGALLFKDMLSQPEPNKVAFIHCELVYGPEKPTPSAKSCSYNRKTKTWSELLGDDCVCDCCDTSCPAPEPSVPVTMVSSSPWALDYKEDNIDQSAPEGYVPQCS